MPALFWLWLVIAVAFLIVEVATPALFFIAFVIGAAAAAATSLLTPSVSIQIAVFAGVSIVMIPLMRTLARKITKKVPAPTNVDALVNCEGVVTKDVDPDQDHGQVRVNGQVWQAQAQCKIVAGEKIRVDEIRGARLYVSKLEVEG